MDLLVRLFLRLGVLFEVPVQRQEMRPIPVPARTRSPNTPGASR